MYMVLGASLTLELTHPRIKGLVGFEHWVADEATITIRLNYILFGWRLGGIGSNTLLFSVSTQ
jgi:hypothetical protein